MMSLPRLLLILSFALNLLSSCEKDNEISLVGTWEISELYLYEPGRISTSGAMSTDTFHFDNAWMLCTKGNYYEFMEDGSFKIIKQGATCVDEEDSFGTWSFANEDKTQMVFDLKETYTFLLMPNWGLINLNPIEVEAVHERWNIINISSDLIELSNLTQFTDFKGDPTDERQGFYLTFKRVE